MENATVIKVGMADLNASVHPGILTTLGLGSCVGIALYDKKTKVVGLAHIMLPSSQQVKNRNNKAKFADTALVKLLDEMLRLGANKNDVIAKIAGGAQMFASAKGMSVMRIGERNVKATKDELQKMGIPLIAEDTGGNYGRTIELYSDTGRLFIRTIGHGVKYI